MVIKSDFDIFASFNADRCTLCGECFHGCPMMQLPLETAKKEIRNLMEGNQTRYVLQKCTSCFVCNLICPEQANPTQLVLDRWRQMYLDGGLPLRAEWFMPHHKPNFRTYVIERLPDDEKLMLNIWNNLSPSKEMLYPGCNIVTSPYLTRTSLLDGLEIRGSLDTCCGEMYYRMGMLKQVEEVSIRMQSYFKKLGLKKMIIPCTAGYNMFSNILPRFGFKPDFEIQHLLVWLWERIEDGRIKIENKLNMRVTIQDSCYGKVFDEQITGLVRQILKKVGIEVTEMRYSCQNSMCCGIAGGFSPISGYSSFRIAQDTIRSLREAKTTGAEAILTYCAGCLQMLSTGKILYPVLMPVYHLLEILQMAIGEQPLRRQDHRGRLFLQGMMLHQTPKMLTGKRFKAEKIEKDW